jgi:DNA-binding LacI/PurR family transcriptional regulator
MTPADNPPKIATRGPRIGFLAAYMNNGYEWDIWRGARAAVEGRGGILLGFAGAGIDDPDPEHRARRAVFDLVDRSNVDAVLCLTSVVGQYASLARVEEWLAEKGVPVCSIGPAERFPSVCVDDASGITQLMAHLIEHHDHGRIAFIKGTESNQEAQRRLAAYHKSLKNHGIASDPRLVLDGDFTAASGVRAMTELFDRRQLRLDQLDAVVACNDYMAFGAIDELVRRRASVPEQIAVVGFDDIAQARVHRPPITTVRQPLEELGRKGALRLLDLLAGRPVAGPLRLETELVLRRSCGCVPTSRYLLPSEPEDTPLTPLKSEILFRDVLRNALAAELRGEVGAFATTIEPFLREIAAGGTTDLDVGRQFADDFCTRMRLARTDVVFERLTGLARVLHTKMFGPQAYLSTALAEHMPSFEIDECSVSEIPRQASAGFPLATLKLAFGFDRATLQPQMVTFDGRELVPGAFAALKKRSAFVMPLTCGAEPLGIAVVPAGAHDGSFYETLAEIFATVLKVLEMRRGAA